MTTSSVRTRCKGGGCALHPMNCRVEGLPHVRRMHAALERSRHPASRTLEFVSQVVIAFFNQLWQIGTEDGAFRQVPK